MEHLDEYWRAVIGKVCSKCIDAGPGGECRLTRDQECALKEHFEALVRTVLSVNSPNVAPYADAIRERVCTACVHRSADSECSLRRELDCGLDRYLPLIIEAIEETHAASCES